MTVLRPAFVAASVTWALLLPLAPFLASPPHATPAGRVLLIAAYAIGGAICHQLPERSYRLWTAQMPVCARCVGIYGGAAVAAVLLSVARGFPAWLKPWRAAAASHGERAAQRRTAAARSTLLVAALPTACSLAYEWIAGDMPAHWIRAGTGVPLGAAVAWMVLSSLPRRRRGENQVN